MILKKFLVITIVLCSIVFAGPFGLNMGMSLKEIGGDPVEIGVGKYKLVNVPKPHSAFEYYIVEVAPKGGLCWIKAIGNDIETSSYGFGVKNAYNEMGLKLEKNYGDCKETDLLLSGSIWDEPSDWMMGLIKKDRYLMMIWERENGSKLPEDIDIIGLMGNATTQSSGYITLEYYFINKDECEAELTAEEDDAL